MVSHEGYVVAERGIAENVVGVLVRVDHIADRLAGDSADRRQQRLPDLHAAAGIDNRDGIAPDDDANVRDVPGIRRARQRDLAKMGVVAIGHRVD